MFRESVDSLVLVNTLFVHSKCIPSFFVCEHVTHLNQMSALVSVSQECTNSNACRQASPQRQDHSLWAALLHRAPCGHTCMSTLQPPGPASVHTHIPCCRHASAQGVCLGGAVTLLGAVLRRGLAHPGSRQGLLGEACHPVCDLEGKQGLQLSKSLRPYNPSLSG